MSFISSAVWSQIKKGAREAAKELGYAYKSPARRQFSKLLDPYELAESMKAYPEATKAFIKSADENQLGFIIRQDVDDMNLNIVKKGEIYINSASPHFKDSPAGRKLGREVGRHEGFHKGLYFKNESDVISFVTRKTGLKPEDVIKAQDFITSPAFKLDPKKIQRISPYAKSQHKSVLNALSRNDGRPFLSGRTHVSGIGEEVGAEMFALKKYPNIVKEMIGRRKKVSKLYSRMGDLTNKMEALEEVDDPAYEVLWKRLQNTSRRVQNVYRKDLDLPPIAEGQYSAQIPVRLPPEGGGVSIRQIHRDT